VPEWLRILHVAQEVHGDDTPVIHSVLQADAYRMSLLRREKEIHREMDEVEEQAVKDKLSAELKELYSKLQFIEADKAEAR
jgi:ATP-binding cassette subfamily F protein 3